MKKLTSLLALFLLCFGITSNAQTLQSVGSNITDPSTQLTHNSYVLLKNVKTNSYVTVDAKGTLVLQQAEPVIGGSTEYLWKIGKTNADKIAFYAADGKLIGKPNNKKPATAVKTVKDNGAWCDVMQYGTGTNWKLFVKWTNYGTTKEFLFASNQKHIVGEKVVAQAAPSAAAEFQIITVTIAKNEEQLAVEELINSWKGLEKYAGGISETDMKVISSKTTLAEVQQAIQAAVKNPIDVSEYFQIVNVKTGEALNVTDGKLTKVAESIFDANQLWQLTQNAQGKYTLHHANYNSYVSVPGTPSLSPAEVEFEIVSLDKAQWSLSANQQFLALNADGTLSAATDAAAEGAQWYLLPKKDLKVSLTPVMNAEGVVVEAWGSIYLPFNATCGNSKANLEYYGVNASGNGVATLQPTDGIAAGKGLILHHVGTQTEFGLKIGKNAKNTDEQAWNLLSGTNVSQAAAGTEYVLGLNGTVAGLYGSNSNVMKANKAFFVPAVQSAVNGFTFNFGDITGIHQVETPAECSEAVYYDLSGRRVLNPANGVYIKNGKKVYVK